MRSRAAAVPAQSPGTCDGRESSAGGVRDIACSRPGAGHSHLGGRPREETPRSCPSPSTSPPGALQQPLQGWPQPAGSHQSSSDPHQPRPRDAKRIPGNQVHCAPNTHLGTLARGSIYEDRGWLSAEPPQLANSCGITNREKIRICRRQSLNGSRASGTGAASRATLQASRGSLGGVHAEAGEAWAAPALPGRDLGGGRTPSPAPDPGSATPRAASAPHYPDHRLPPPPPNREGFVSAQYPNLFCIYFFSGAK